MTTALTTPSAPQPGRASNSLLFQDIRSLITACREGTARFVNAGLVILYLKIGTRIRGEILNDKRATYGKEIVATLSQQLQKEFGNGFSRASLARMVQLAEQFPDEKIVATLSRQLGWSHFLLLLPLKTTLQREFYAEMCRVEGWSVRTLREKIAGMLFERTALSKKPEQLVRRELKDLRENDRWTPDMVFRDPYFLDFLGLKGAYQEKDLENAILREMEAFILELGSGFAFVARQKRIQLDGDDYYLDLLFFHRKLKRLIAIDLKLREFRPGDKGQMELYLRWLSKYETQQGEAAPIGLILCAGKKNEQIELLDLQKSGIRVAEYLTALPPLPELKEKLHQVIKTAREQAARRQLIYPPKRPQ
jgi:predicted nuclease of restriction endonuclease-like (RecB) superfamily